MNSKLILLAVLCMAVINTVTSNSLHNKGADCELGCRLHCLTNKFEYFGCSAAADGSYTDKNCLCTKKDCKLGCALYCINNGLEYFGCSAAADGSYTDKNCLCTKKSKDCELGCTLHCVTNGLEYFDCSAAADGSSDKNCICLKKEVSSVSSI